MDRISNALSELRSAFEVRSGNLNNHQSAYNTVSYTEYQNCNVPVCQTKCCQPCYTSCQPCCQPCVPCYCAPVQYVVATTQKKEKKIKSMKQVEIKEEQIQFKQRKQVNYDYNLRPLEDQIRQLDGLISQVRVIHEPKQSDFDIHLPEQERKVKIVPEIREVIKVVEVPKETIKEVIRTVEVPKETIREVIKPVEVIKEVIRPFETIKEVIKEVVKYVDKPYEVIKEVIRDVPREVIKEVIKEVEKPVYLQPKYMMRETIYPVIDEVPVVQSRVVHRNRTVVDEVPVYRSQIIHRDQGYYPQYEMLRQELQSTVKYYH